MSKTLEQRAADITATINGMTHRQLVRFGGKHGLNMSLGDYMKISKHDLANKILAECEPHYRTGDGSAGTTHIESRLAAAFPEGIFTRGSRHGNHGGNTGDSDKEFAESARFHAVPTAEMGATKPIPVPAYIPPSGDDSAALAALRALLGANATVNPEQVREIVRAELAGLVLPVTVMVSTDKAEPVKLDGVHHKRFPQLLRYMQSGNHIWLYGPKGTGKTTAAHNAANALGRGFASDGITGEEHKILGYMDAHGRYVSTNFRKAFETGLVYLADELDSWLPPATMALQSALANGFCSFPDGLVKRHESFQFIGAANTAGYGATFEYAGRQKQDGAFLDRLIYLYWEIDEVLEKACAGNDKWTLYVQDVRRKVQAKGIKGLDVSPRASIFGAKMLAANCTWEEAQEACLKRGMTDEQWQGVR